MGLLACRYNAELFDNKLPADLHISWSTKLKTTAGLTHFKRSTCSDGTVTHLASVDLSTKVVDGMHKLEQTLCHELCHVASWVVDKACKPPHGPHFRAWADRVMRRRPDLRVETCHNYAIHFPYRWQCTTAWCKRIYKRHSNSINVEKQVCSACEGRLLLLGKFQADGTPSKQRAPSGFSLFVRDHFSAVKSAAKPGTPHKEIMQTLSNKWKNRSPSSIKPAA
eukprot:jgi/Astpho2/1488/e_gw1.00026.148.1_t